MQKRISISFDKSYASPKNEKTVLGVGKPFGDAFVDFLHHKTCSGQYHMWFSDDFDVYFIRKGYLTPNFGALQVHMNGFYPQVRIPNKLPAKYIFVVKSNVPKKIEPDEASTLHLSPEL